MKIRTNRLKDKALDWAVATCEGAGTPYINAAGKRSLAVCQYSTDWAQGGPIIDRGKLSVGLCHPRPSWATRDTWFAHENRTDERPSRMLYGPTPLIAAMRCRVASKLGNEVDIPEELL